MRPLHFRLPGAILSKGKGAVIPIKILTKLKWAAIGYGAYLCLFTVVAVLAWYWRWDVGFPLVFLAGGALLLGAARFTSYYDRHPELDPPPEDADPKSARLRKLDRWLPLLLGVLVALPPLIYIQLVT